MIIFPFPGYEILAQKISSKLSAKVGELEVREFPDKESFVRIGSEVRDEDVILLCGLEEPNSKALAAIFFADTAKELGAKKVGLVAPYLGYMRQDTRFHNGEAVSSKIFAGIVSQHFDWLITVDPHLHRYKSLDEIYSIPSLVLHATEQISKWIKLNIPNPLIIGPDQESKQWVEAIAKHISAPYEILNKTRLGDEEVKISLPNIRDYRGHIPVLVDDIISTAHTMAQTVKHLIELGMSAPTCVGVHAIFAKNGYEILQQAGAAKIITCNTVAHPSNAIDIDQLIIKAVENFYER